MEMLIFTELWKILCTRIFSADGGHRLEPIIEESKDDFEDVPDYVEGQNDLQESRGEDDSKIINE